MNGFCANLIICIDIAYISFLYDFQIRSTQTYVAANLCFRITQQGPFSFRITQQGPTKTERICLNYTLSSCNAIGNLHHLKLVKTTSQFLVI